MEWAKVASAEIFHKNLENAVDWQHSFIREISVVSPSYVLPKDRSTVAPDFLPSARVFISSSSADVPGLELLFVEVDEFAVEFGGELQPEFAVSDNSVVWRFRSSAQSSVTCRSIFYRFLGSDTWGRNLRYGWEDVFDAGGELIIV